MELVFISSPYRGDIVKNTENAKKYCEWVGYDNKVPFAPHLYFTTFLEEKYDRWKGMYWGKCLMKLCSEIQIYCNELTQGMIEEITETKKLGLPMKFHNTDMEVITHENYLIHTELGPAYRRVIAEYYGDRFYFESCGKCRVESGNTDNSVKSEEEYAGIKPEHRSIWDRLVSFFC